jgi:integrase/recombinase XerC
VNEGVGTVNIYEGDTLKHVLADLGIAKTSYYRMRKQGTLHDEIVERDGERLWRVVVLEPGDTPVKENKICQIFSHRRFMREWIEWNEDGIHKTPWSASYKKKQLEYIEKYFNRYDLISAENLVDWLKTYYAQEHREGKRKTPHVDAMQVTLKRHMQSCVSNYARFLYEQKGILTLDDYSKIKLLYPKRPPRYQPTQNLLYDEDLEPIQKAIGKLYEKKAFSNELLLKTVLTLLAETGLRIHELCSLSLENLNFSDNPMRSVLKVRGKGGKERMVPFSKRAQAIINEYLQVERNGNKKSLFWVTNTNNGRKTPLKVDWLAHEIEAVSELADIKFTAHSFRHYRATQWANDARIPITTTQRWLGHESLQVTQRYIHTSDEMAMQAAFA